MLLSPQKFDGMAVGETDWRAIDITKDCEGVTVSSVVWTCQLAPGSPGIDPTPQARILSSQVQTTITILVGPQNTPKILTGVFAVVQLDGFPSSAIGATYLLISTALLADGRILIDSAHLPCTAT
jgi:hypothetical protein